MTIEPLGPVDPVQKFNKPQKTVRPQESNPADSISVSSEAKERAELMQLAESVRNLPEIREDRVAEVRRKLEDPSYIDDKVIDTVADNIMSAFGL